MRPPRPRTPPPSDTRAARRTARAAARCEPAGPRTRDSRSAPTRAGRHPGAPCPAPYPGRMAAEVTLTFDNGPDADATPLVLDALAARGLRATFFVVGEQLAAHRGPAERAHAEGHWIGNHTWTHRAPFGRLEDASAPHREIERTQALLGALAHPDRLFRPVGGGELGPHVLTPETVEVLVAGGYTCTLWNAVPGDWRDPDGWVERALEQCRSAGRALLVLHDLPTGAMAHLARFLDAAAGGGMRVIQQLPEACLPIVRGEVVRPLDRLGG